MEGITTIEKRIDRIEIGEKSSQKNEENILNTLHRIEDRLLGSLSGDTPGLINEVKEVQKDLDSLKLSVSDLLKNFTDVKKALDELSRYKWVTYGVLITLGWVVSHIGTAWELLKKIH